LSKLKLKEYLECIKMRTSDGGPTKQPCKWVKRKFMKDIKPKYKSSQAKSIYNSNHEVYSLDNTFPDMHIVGF
jgi:hypothetical protein